MNCVNCGAPIKDGKCEYCGAEYHKLNSLDGSFDEYQGEITIDGKKIRCYIGDMKVEHIFNDCASRDRNGNLQGEVIAIKRKITLIEY